jgi:hypothetical protein
MRREDFSTDGFLSESTKPSESAEDLRRAQNTERQRRSRELRRLEAEARTESLDTWGDSGNFDARMAMSIVERLRQFLIHELRRYDSKATREAVMEVFLGSDEVQQHMPDYYPPPKDARIHLQVVRSLRDCLDIVKGAHSSEMLAYKGALLDAVVMGDLRGKGRALDKVL